jgi:hypothetical protein
MREIGRRDADAGVADAEGDLVVRPPCQRDLDVTTARRVLDRVGDEVEKKLAQPVGIAENGRILAYRQFDR